MSAVTKRAPALPTAPRQGSALTPDAHQKALKLCHEWDVDNDGAISREELGLALKGIFPDVSEGDVEAIMQTVDVNKDGVIEYNEVLEWLRLPPHEKMCFEDSLMTYVRTGVAGPIPSSRSQEPKLWDDTLLYGFTHQLLSHFRVLECDATTPPVPPEVVQVRLLQRGVRVGAGKAPCTVISGKTPTGRPFIDASVKTLDCTGTEEQKLLATLQHYAEVHLCLLEAFVSTLPTGKSSSSLTGRYSGYSATPKLRFEPLPVLGPDGQMQPPVPLAFWSATALALARLSPGRQKKLAGTCIDVCVGTVRGAHEFKAVLESKVKVAEPSSQFCDETLPQRRGCYSWIRQDTDAEARLCRMHAFMLTQRMTFTGSCELVKPRRVLTLKKVQAMVNGSTTRTVKPVVGLPPPPNVVSGTPTRLLVSADLGLHLPPRATVMDVVQALVAQGRKVAAVNAASAYSVGGGCSSGGRHALEEAWCSVSTLFSSLAAVRAAALTTPEESAGVQLQHVPTTGCVVSPKVEIFREGTDCGYRFLPEVICLAGVLSVAMFNRNPAVTDSPLDCPEDPPTYVAQTQAKLEAVVLAARDLAAEVLVVPDVGCGVFQNDPRVVGGCLGAVLQRNSGAVGQVVLLSSGNAAFTDACQRAFRGEDPRETCSAGSACPQLADPHHAARMLHRPSTDSLENALVTLASHPEAVKKPACRYGAFCHIRKPDHLERFAHPPPSETIPWCKDDENPMPVEFSPNPKAEMKLPVEPVKPEPVKPPPREGHACHPTPAGPARPAPVKPSRSATELPEPALEVPALPRGLPGAERGLPPDTSGAAELPVREISRQVCKYGEKCYNKNPKHLKDFAHPWLDGGETPSQAKERLEETDVHDLLTIAKGGSWLEVKAILRNRPHFVNMRPEMRSFGLVHHAAWQIRMDEMEMLVLDFSADLSLRTREGKTAEDVLKESVQLGGLSEAERARAEALQHWLQRRKRGGRAASPAGRAPSPAGRAAREASPARASPSSGATGSSGSSSGGRLQFDPPSGAQLPKITGANASEPPLLAGGAVLTVSGSLNPKLNGPYAELGKVHNGYGLYWKRPTPSSEAFYMYYNYRSGLGWVIDSDISDSKEPLAYLGDTSVCRGDPSAKAYAEAWRVQSYNKIAGVHYAKDVVMRVRRS